MDDLDANAHKHPVYWPELDGLRSVAFLLVFLSHCPPNAHGAVFTVINTYCAWGWVGVDLFFVLSGFLITYLLVKEKFSFGSISIINFYKRRALRIWPLYFLMLFGISLFPLLLHHWNGQFRIFLQQVIFPFFVFAGNYAMIWQFSVFSQFCEHWGIVFPLYVGLLVPLWSLCIEEQFYLFWPSLLNFAKSTRGIYLAIGLLFISSIVVRLILVTTAIRNSYSHSYFYMDSFSHLDALMIGAGIAVSEYSQPGWFARFTRESRGWLIFGVVSFIFCIIPLTVPSIYDKQISIVPTMTVTALAFGTLLLLAQNWHPLKNILRNKILCSIGRVSYAMYLFHLFLVRFVESKLPALTGNQDIDWFIRALLSLILTYIAAQLSWNLLEKRFLKARIKFTRVPSETSLLADETNESAREKASVLALASLSSETHLI